MASITCFLAVASEKKAVVSAFIERRQNEIIDLSDQIWRFDELTLLETNSSKVLADYAERHEFIVEREVANLPTAFVASFGEGKPMIGIVGEYDAVPGLSQRAAAAKEFREASAPGHGLGHNLFGPGSLGAGVAIEELIAPICCLLLEICLSVGTRNEMPSALSAFQLSWK